MNKSDSCPRTFTGQGQHELHDYLVTTKEKHRVEALGHLWRCHFYGAVCIYTISYKGLEGFQTKQNSVQRVQEALVWDGAEAPLSLVRLQQSEPENNTAGSWDDGKRPCGILRNVLNLRDTEATAPWKKPWHKSYHPQHQHQYCIFSTPLILAQCCTESMYVQFIVAPSCWSFPCIQGFSRQQTLYIYYWEISTLSGCTQFKPGLFKG